MPSHKDQNERRAYHREYMRRRYANDFAFREKQKARAAVGHAIRDGRLDRKPCSKCGKTTVEGHHGDYQSPLVVDWLCRSCHEGEHGGAGCHGVGGRQVSEAVS